MLAALRELRDNPSPDVREIVFKDNQTRVFIDEDSLTNVGDITGLMPGPDDMELSADKRYLWVTFRFAKHVGIIDLSTRKLIQTIAVGRSPHGIYFFNRAPVTAPNGA